MEWNSALWKTFSYAIVLSKYSATNSRGNLKPDGIVVKKVYFSNTSNVMFGPSQIVIIEASITR